MLNVPRSDRRSRGLPGSRDGACERYGILR